MWSSALVITLLVVGQASSQDSPWNSIQVTWGIRGKTPDVFHAMPLTAKEAEKAGYMVADDGCCSGVFTGLRYYDPKDLTVSLLYDVGGNVAGIQTNFVIASLTDDWVKNWFAQGNMHIKNTLNGVDVYTVTAYLIDQAIICTTGRTAEQVKEAPSGDQLSYQTKGDLMKIPLLQEDVEKQPVWANRKCFPSMGVHYWYQNSLDMDCNDFIPVFILYNRCRLNAFGMCAIAMPQNSTHLEHPPSNTFPLFMAVVPKCLEEKSEELGGVTTIHFYLNSDEENRQCV